MDVYARQAQTTNPRFSNGVPFEVLCKGCGSNTPQLASTVRTARGSISQMQRL